MVYNVRAPLRLNILDIDLPCCAHMVTLFAYGTLCHHFIVSGDGFNHIALSLAYANLWGRLLLLLYRVFALRLDNLSGWALIHCIAFHLLTQLDLMS